MKIKPFAVEEWMNAYEDGARYNIAETCVDSVSLDELFELTGEDKQAFLERFCARRLTYGDIAGSEALREGVCGLYKTLKPSEVVPTHGAAGANYHVFCSLISPGDGVERAVLGKSAGADSECVETNRGAAGQLGTGCTGFPDCFQLCGDCFR